MASSVQVLCPNGRRQNVKVTANTKLLQIIEEVCLKQGFQPVEEYELRQGRKVLDPTVIYRYSGLSNHAKLDLVKAEKKRAESNVVVALQMDSGERLQADFPPSASLTDVLAKWTDLTAVRPGLQRVCIYMREEIVGEVALSDTSLRKLGLVGGKGLLRLVYREVDNATLEAVEQKIAKEKEKLARMAACGSSLVERHLSAERTVSSMTSSPAPELMDTDDDTNIVGSPSDSQAKPTSLPVNKAESSVSDGARPQESQQRPQEGAVQPVNISAPGSNEQLPPHIRAQVQQLAASLMPGADAATLQQMLSALSGRSQGVAGGSQGALQQVYVQPFAQGFKFPEATKGQQLYKNELSRVNRQEFTPCDRETVVYSLEEVRPHSPASDELPDSFFELTESDIRKMWADLQSKAESEAPLLTVAMRQQQQEARMDRYPRVIMRVHFPERVVLQGVFNVRESVHALHKYVKEHLEDKTQDFYLYTAPPKHVLKDHTQNLFEAGLAPMCVVYFGSVSPRDANISSAVISEMATMQVADSIVMKYMSKSGQTSNDTAASSLGESSGTTSSSAAVASKRSAQTGGGNPSTSSSSKIATTEDAKVPKWFKAGKK